MPKKQGLIPPVRWTSRRHRKMLSIYQKLLTNEVRKYLRDNPRNKRKSIEKYQIGWSDKRERLTFPVYDKDGKLVNVRFHAWKSGQKPKNLKLDRVRAEKIMGRRSPD
jgi:hypothetical protein